MADDKRKTPGPEDLEKELSDYLSKKYGQRIKVISPMMSDENHSKKEKSTAEEIRFDMKPEELEEYLNRYVVRQDDAKAILATKICTHYNRIRARRRSGRADRGHDVGRIKNNILLMGPTGVGKTYLIKLIADKLRVPFVKGDATKFSETGYVGGDVEDLVRDLVREADDDIEAAQYGIVYVDEIDKIAGSSNLLGPDVSRSGVQRALLKPMEETEVELKVAHDPISQIQAIEQYRRTGKREKRTVNTKNILFIMSGAFSELPEMVKKRVQKQGVGFGAEIASKGTEHQYMKQVKSEDLVNYGFEREFIGRLPVIAVLDPLTTEDLYQILHNPNSPILLGKKEDFRCYGIDVRFEEEALQRLADMASQENTGARALVTAVEKVLMPFEKRLPSTSLRRFVVTSAVVDAAQEELEKLLADPDNPEMLRRYREIYEEEKREAQELLLQGKQAFLENYPDMFSPSRLELMVEHHVRTGLPVEGVFDEVMMLYNQVRGFESDFYENHGFHVRFEEQAVTEIIEQALRQEIPASTICEDISRDFDYGFNLVFDRCGRTRFELPRQAVQHPERFLDELIRKTYQDYPKSASDPGTAEGRQDGKK